jgi:hypothetical protein
MPELAVIFEDPEPESSEEDETLLYDISPRDQIIAISIAENHALGQDVTAAADVLFKIQKDMRWEIQEEERIRHVHAAQPSNTSFSVSYLKLISGN